MRDLLIGKDPEDIDLVVKGDVGQYAINLARKIKGSLFILDRRRKVFRIICKEDSPSLCYDLSPMRGDNIHEDLSFRDFTIDAMAVHPDLNLNHIIDPFNGQSDIQNKCIRHISREAFKHDPLRMLRAFRLAGTLDFHVEQGTYNNIKELSSSLRLASRERTRDEFFKLLTCRNSANILIEMHKTGLLGEVLPGLSYQNIEKGLITLERLENIFNSLSDYFQPVDAEIRNYLSIIIEYGITNLTVWKWISMYSSTQDRTSHREIVKSAEELRLGKKVCKLGLLSSQYRDVLFLNQGTANVKPVYYFFKSSGDDGIGQLLYLIASKHSELEANNIEIINGLNAITWYLTEYKRIKTSPLITGDDLREIFDIPPGPFFRQLLDRIEEDRVLGKIYDKKAAVALLKELLKKI